MEKLETLRSLCNKHQTVDLLSNGDYYIVDFHNCSNIMGNYDKAVMFLLGRNFSKRI